MVAGATEDRLRQAPVIAVLTMTIGGQHDPFTLLRTGPPTAAGPRKYEHRVLPVGDKPAA
jgi:hypothetical protein